MICGKPNVRAGREFGIFLCLEHLRAVIQDREAVNGGRFYPSLSAAGVYGIRDSSHPKHHFVSIANDEGKAYAVAFTERDAALTCARNMNEEAAKRGVDNPEIGKAA